MVRNLQDSSGTQKVHIPGIERYVELNNKKYVIKSKSVDWTNGMANMYIFEQPKKVNIQNINPYLYNDQYKVILRQFASELKRLLNCIMNELSNLDKEDRLFRNLRNSIKVMTSMIEEIIGIVTFNNNDVPEAETEEFTIRDLLDEVYNIMSSKIKASKLDYIQMITPELENINISSEKSTIKQILLNLLTNAIMNTDKGQLKVE